MLSVCLKTIAVNTDHLKWHLSGFYIINNFPFYESIFKYCVYIFSLIKFLYNSLASSDDSYQNQLLLYLSNSDFPITRQFLLFICQYSSIRAFSSLPGIWYLFMHLYKCELMDFYFIQWQLYSVFKVYHFGPAGVPSSWFNIYITL